jgi:hypothetical protein
MLPLLILLLLALGLGCGVGRLLSNSFCIFSVACMHTYIHSEERVRVARLTYYQDTWKAHACSVRFGASHHFAVWLLRRIHTFTALIGMG